MCQGTCATKWHGHKLGKSLGLMALRITVAIVFIYMGYHKVGPNHTMTTAMMGKLIGPASAGSFWAYFVGSLEMLGGAMVLLGVYANIASIWLSIVLVVAMLTAHPAGSPAPSYFLELAMLGSTLALAGNGAGRFRLVKSQCRCKKCMGAMKEMEGKDGCGGCGGACGCGGGVKMEMKSEEIKK